MVNDRSAGSNKFQIQQNSAKSSAFEVNDRSNASSAFKLGQADPGMSIGSIDFQIGTHSHLGNMYNIGGGHGPTQMSSAFELS